MSGVRFQQSQEVDFVIVGSGAAGGVMAKQLATSGFSVVVLDDRFHGAERAGRDSRHGTGRLAHHL